MILKKIDAVCKKYKFDIEDFKPKDIKGNEHIIGLWDYDDHYETFKTLGAKRYMVKYAKDSHHYKQGQTPYNLTISGLNKKKAMPYLESLAKEQKTSVFDLFTDEMFVDGEHSGKLLHTYIDDRKEFDVVDYLGNKSHIIALSGVHLEPSSYSLSLAEQYKKYISNVETHYKRGN